MANFDKGGFAAVDAFFGEDSKDDLKDENMSEKHNRRLERAGVGSAITSSHSLATVNSTQSIVNKRVSQVGRSDPVDDDSSQESEEDEEEEGRTAIASKSAPAAVQPAAAASEHNRTKKKRGKKERQKEKDAQQQKIQSTTSMYENTLGQEATQPGSEHSQKKRKRRKVRSRQKNICKDNRTNRPSDGRPLSITTIEKLAGREQNEAANLEQHSTERASVESTSSAKTQQGTLKRKLSKYKNLQ